MANDVYRELRSRMGFAYFWWWRLWVFFAGGVWWAFGSWAPPSVTAFLMRTCEAVARLEFPVA